MTIMNNMGVTLQFKEYNAHFTMHEYPYCSYLQYTEIWNVCQVAHAQTKKQGHPRQHFSLIPYHNVQTSVTGNKYKVNL